MYAIIYVNLESMCGAVKKYHCYVFMAHHVRFVELQNVYEAHICKLEQETNFKYFHSFH